MAAYFKVGYFQEEDDESGLAHLMEHMFFKGSASMPAPDEIGHAVRELGGQLNASTTYDRTCYYFILPRNALEPAIRIMADAVLRPVLDAGELEKEVEVIIEESRRKRDNPPAIAAELMYERMFDVHRMRRWRIGNDVVLRALTRQQAISFHDRLYRPDHLIISIVGDIDPEAARAISVDAFSALPVGRPERTCSPAEPPPGGLRAAAVRAPIQQTYLEIGFRTPGVAHPDREGLALLAYLLGGGRSSRLFQEVKSAAGLVRTVDTTARAYDDVGLLRISATLEASELSAARRKTFEELERVRRWGFSRHELAVARNRIDAGQLFQLEEVTGQALKLAYHEAYGDYRHADRARARLLSISSSELRRLARRYLTPENATVFAYLPMEAPAEGDVLEAVHEEWRSAQNSQLARLPSGPLPARPRARRLGSPKHHLGARSELLPLSDGGALLAMESGQLPLVSIGVYFAGGRSREPAGLAGLTRLGLRAARHGGTTSYRPDALQAAVAGMGGRLDTVLEAHYLGFSFQLPSPQSGTGLELLAELIVDPAFDPVRLDGERQALVADIRQSREQTVRSAVDLLRRTYFGADNALGSPTAGLEHVVCAARRDEVIAWHLGGLSRGNRFVVAAGDLNRERLVRVVEQKLQGLPAQPVRVLPGEGACPEDRRGSPQPHERSHQPSQIRELVESCEKCQTALAIGFPAPCPEDPDYPALVVMLEILSGMGGRLMAELRGRQSLAYSVSAWELGLRRDNLQVCAIAGDPSKEAAARSGILEELDKLRQSSVTASELSRAKASLLGKRAIGEQRLAARVARCAWAHLNGMGLETYDRIPDLWSQVSGEDVLSVARRYLTLDHYAIGIVRGQSRSGAARLQS